MGHYHQSRRNPAFSCSSHHVCEHRDCFFEMLDGEDSEASAVGGIDDHLLKFRKWQMQQVGGRSDPDGRQPVAQSRSSSFACPITRLSHTRDAVGCSRDSELDLDDPFDKTEHACRWIASVIKGLAFPKMSYQPNGL